LCGFGIPDREYGERLCACIELERGATVSAFAIHAYLRGRLANFKVPKEIRFLDALPREETGKIFKRKLREPYWQDRSPASSIPTGTSLTST
jgi:long-chain acyl-CoA synthetase